MTKNCSRVCRLNYFAILLLVSVGQQCKLSCIAEVGIRQFAKYSFGFVADGTRCDDYDENSGLCVNGKCQVKLFLQHLDYARLLRLKEIFLNTSHKS